MRVRLDLGSSINKGVFVSGLAAANRIGCVWLAANRIGKTARLLRERLAGCKQPLRCVWFDRFTPRDEGDGEGDDGGARMVAWHGVGGCRGGVTVAGKWRRGVAAVDGVVAVMVDRGGVIGGDGAVVERVIVAVWRRVVASDIMDRVDRVIRSNFGFAEKSPPENFSDGGVVVAGRRWLPDFWRRM
nr:hypothetical protein [Tanacetum cinerariifolium]